VHLVRTRVVKSRAWDGGVEVNHHVLLNPKNPVGVPGEPRHCPKKPNPHCYAKGSSNLVSKVSSTRMLSLNQPWEALESQPFPTNSPLYYLVACMYAILHHQHRSLLLLLRLEVLVCTERKDTADEDDRVETDACGGSVGFGCGLGARCVRLGLGVALLFPISIVNLSNAVSYVSDTG
jgi:hypothetical protein